MTAPDQPTCDCELRDRQWNPCTGRCNTCSRIYVDARFPAKEKTATALDRLEEKLKAAKRNGFRTVPGVAIKDLQTVIEMLAPPPDPHLAAAREMMRPAGRCCCAGQGSCAWCAAHPCKGPDCRSASRQVNHSFCTFCRIRQKAYEEERET